MTIEVIMKKCFQYSIVITTLIAAVVACKKVTDPVCSLLPARFSLEVNPIIQNSCTSSGCHGAGSSNGPGELLTFDQIKNAAARIKKAVEDKTMPKGSTLTSAQIQQISCWVDNGARND